MKRSDFPIFLIGMHDYVEGSTRLQKYVFLSSMQIKELRSDKFYNDWKAGNFGPFSAKLANDVETAINNGDVKNHIVKNAYDFKVTRFAITEKGKELADKLKDEYPNLYIKILTMTKKYQDKSLVQLLQDVYYQYPQYATASEIKAEIGRGIYESDSYLSKDYDEPDSEYPK